MQGTGTRTVRQTVGYWVTRTVCQIAGYWVQEQYSGVKGTLGNKNSMPDRKLVDKRTALRPTEPQVTSCLNYDMPCILGWGKVLNMDNSDEQNLPYRLNLRRHFPNSIQIIPFAGRELKTMDRNVNKSRSKQ